MDRAVTHPTYLYIEEFTTESTLKSRSILSLHSIATMAVIEVEYSGAIAVIVLNKPNKLNALTKDEFYELARTLQDVGNHDEVVATVLTGTGRFFSA
jgi:1,4-dihydroxy-2-naphthoyl-CoA synthase